MRIAVTGANGFVGRSIIQAIRNRGHNSIALLRENNNNGHYLSADEIEIIGDVGHRKDIFIRSRFDALIHLAALTHMNKNQKKDEDILFKNVNVIGTERIIKAAKSAGARRVVFMSTIKVNGESSVPGKPLTSNDPAAPEDLYARSKLEAELAGAKLAKQLDLDWVAIRPPLVFGSGAKGNLRMLSKIVKMGIPLPFGSIVNRRSMVHVDNLSDLTVHCCESQAISNVILASDGTNISTVELVNAIASAQGVAAKMFRCPPKLLNACAKLFGYEQELSRLTGTLEVSHGSTNEMLGWRPPIEPHKALRGGLI